MRPEDVLPDGKDSVQLGDVTVRKGSVAAFMANARVLADPAASDAQREECRRHVAEMLPALRALGVFEVFELRDPIVRRELALLADG